MAEEQKGRDMLERVLRDIAMGSRESPPASMPTATERMRSLGFDDAGP